MENLFLLLLLACLSFLIIGLVKPETSLFWNKANPTKKKSLIIYGSSGILFFILFGVTSDINKASENRKPISTTEYSNIEAIPYYKHVDSLEKNFSSPLFNYYFKKVRDFSKKNVTICGFESDNITGGARNNNLLIQFDPRNKEIYLASLTIIVDDYKIKPSQIEQIYKFAGFFDSSSEKYFRSHFKDIFINNKTYLDSSGFTCEQKNLDLVINHNLLAAKELVQREGKSSSEGQALDVTIEVSNKNKSLFE